MFDLREKYKKEAVPAMREKLGYENIMSLPKIIKVVINTGIGRISKETGVIEDIRRDLSLITGQWPVLVAAKKSISAFKIRQGMPAGLKVTLHGAKMYDFLSRLINVAFPRSRDFRGIDRKNIDQDGNLNIGIKENIIFPEAVSDDIRKIFGFEVNIVTSAGSRDAAEILFEVLGFPLKSKVG